MLTAGYASALLHLFIWSPGIIEIRSVDVIALSYSPAN
jgi:hypothetical protein